ncbi:hypothetical protein V6N11_007374 [Hibiscus sabdariffa]|uniref:Uncharacterized protein n=1 Tax=Hibiscus sabdariffa TaxID=183260 RepID=A0ABR2A9B9_9ROSI
MPDPCGLVHVKWMDLWMASADSILHPVRQLVISAGTNSLNIVLIEKVALEAKNQTHALWIWCHNRYSFRVDVTSIVRQPDQCPSRT